MRDTADDSYADRLLGLSTQRWKQLLGVQAPYRRNLRRQQLGRTLDVGCGLGRNLAVLDPGSVGVDHNEKCIDIARSQGLTAFTPSEFQLSQHATLASFDGLLLAHVIEHMTRSDALALLDRYVPYLAHGGRAFFICPQERGFRSDDTHVEFTSGEDLQQLAMSAGLVPEPWHSFPLPRVAGELFTYNEFTLLARKP